MGYLCGFAQAVLWRRDQAWQLGVFAVFLGTLSLLVQLPAGRGDFEPVEEGLKEVTIALRDLAEKEDPSNDRRGVLALWNHGAKLQHYARCPVVASGYYRNLEGIRDSYRVLTARNWDGYGEILRARKVRFIVSMAIPSALATVDQVLPELGEFGRVAAVVREHGKVSAKIEMFKSIFGTLWWYLILNPKPDPLFRVWRVLYPDEGR